MASLHDVSLAFALAFRPENLLYALIAAALGTLVGTVPSIGTTAAVAMLLPLAHVLGPLPTLILFAGVCSGAQFARSTPAILCGRAGPESAASGIDGHQMARQGRAGAALTLAAGSWFLAGAFGTLALAVVAPWLAQLGAQFGPHEIFALILASLIAAVALVPGSLNQSLAMLVLGLLLADLFGSSGLGDALATMRQGSAAGVGIVVVAIGVLVFAGIVARLGDTAADTSWEAAPVKVERLGPTRRDLDESWPALLRGTALGAIFGALPGAGGVRASFVSYRLERRLAREPRVAFGKGAAPGVTGPEAAHGAGAKTALLATLALGIAPNALMALLLAAVALAGLQPGPQLVLGSPQLIGGLIAAMWVGSVMLLALHLPSAGLRARLLAVRYRVFFPALALVSCIGVYGLGNNTFDLYLVAVFAAIGYVFHQLGCATPPLLLGLALGPMLEDNLRRALVVSNGEWGSFARRPLAASLLAVAALCIVAVALLSVGKKRALALDDD